MNILYISHLSGSQFGGPNYSVPAQISAQSRIDNVFWYNLTEPVMDHWVSTGLFHNASDFPKRNISSLPEPFNKPDLVVFEDFYYFDDCQLGKECKKKSIPYIIIPRGALTKKAQKTKKLKKIVANLLFFRPFTRNAIGIEYLTESEKQNSGLCWNKNVLVIPNGVNRIPFINNNEEGNGTINGVYIGRFMPAKGIDLLVEAVGLAQDSLRQNNIHISLYGPKAYDLWKDIYYSIHEKKLDDILFIHDAVIGDEKELVLKSADFFIMTSRFEGMPMGLIEALGYSLPCIVTSGTNMRNEIEIAAAGWGSATDARGIASSLEMLCRNKNNLSIYRKNAYNLAGEYEWDKMAIKAHNVYERLLIEV